MSGSRIQNALFAPLVFVATGAFALPVMAQPASQPESAKAPIVPQPVKPAAPAPSEPPVVPQSVSPIDVEQVKPKEDVTLKETAPNNPRPKITTRDGLAAEQ